MKILIVINLNPFAESHMRTMALALQENMIKMGHKADVLQLPLQLDSPSILPSQLLMIRALALENVDRVIALQFPASLIQHPQKIAWLSDAYPLHCAILAENPSLQAIVNNASQQSLVECKKVFMLPTIDHASLKKIKGVSARILPFPESDIQWSSTVRTLLK